MTSDQAPDPKKLQEKVKSIAGMMTGAHVAAMVALGVRLGLYGVPISGCSISSSAR